MGSKARSDGDKLNMQEHMVRLVVQSFLSLGTIMETAVSPKSLGELVNDLYVTRGYINCATDVFGEFVLAQKCDELLGWVAPMLLALRNMESEISALKFDDKGSVFFVAESNEPISEAVALTRAVYEEWDEQNHQRAQDAVYLTNYVDVVINSDEDATHFTAEGDAHVNF